MVRQLASHRLIFLVFLAIAAAPAGGVLASVWPVEPKILGAVCLYAALPTFAALIGVRSLQLLFAGTTAIAILVSLMTTHWPLRAAHAISRPAFDRIAADVRAGTPPDMPCWAGLFRIQRAELNRRGIICLWTEVDTAGPQGFVQWAGVERPPFNLWSHLPLNDTWHFIAED